MSRLETIRQAVLREFPKAQVCEGENADKVRGLYIDYDGNGTVDTFFNPDKTGLAAYEQVTGPVRCTFGGLSRFGARPPTITPQPPATPSSPTPPAAPPATPTTSQPTAARAPTPARTIVQSAAGKVRQEPTGRIVVSGFTNRGAGLALLNKAYQAAIAQGQPVVLVHGASHCVGCKKMVAAAEQAGMTVIYLEDDAEKMGELYSLPQIFVLPADPKLRLEAGKIPVRATVPGVDEFVAYQARGMQQYDNHQKTGEQQIGELGAMIARTPVAPELKRTAVQPPAAPPSTPVAPSQPPATPPVNRSTRETARNAADFEAFVRKNPEASFILFVPPGTSEAALQAVLQSRSAADQGLPVLLITTDSPWAQGMAQAFFGNGSERATATSQPHLYRTANALANITMVQ